MQKVSSLENSIIDRVEQHRALEESHRKLQQVCRTEEEKSRVINGKYKEISGEFTQLKDKCGVMFNELETRKHQRQSDAEELVRVRKELVLCKDQLEGYKNKDLEGNVKLTESLKLLRSRLSRV